MNELWKGKRHACVYVHGRRDCRVQRRDEVSTFWSDGAAEREFHVLDSISFFMGRCGRRGAGRGRSGDIQLTLAHLAPPALTHSLD
jgi:hypothetical protein